MISKSQHATQYARVKTRSSIFNHQRLPFLPVALSALLMAIASALTGCTLSMPGLSGTGAPEATAAPIATPPPPPKVTVAVIVEQEGTVAAHNVQLLVTVAVTNQTTAPISITGTSCNSPNPPILIDVLNTEEKIIWQTHLFDGPCPHVQPIDVAHLAPHAIQRWTIANDLSHNSIQYGNAPPGPPPLVANASYTVRATLEKWHQGSVEDIGNPNVVQGQDVTGDAVVVLR
jgi:hypothetical protein